MTQTLYLQGHTATLNLLLRGHWFAHRLKKRDRLWIELEAKSQGIVPAAGKRLVKLIVTMAPKQRCPDPDAWQKSIGDALTHAGLILDDNHKWVEWCPVVYQRGEFREMAILLEDV